MTDNSRFGENLGVNEPSIGLDRDRIEHSSVEQLECTIDVLDADVKKHRYQLIVAPCRNFSDERIPPLSAVTDDDIDSIRHSKQIGDV